MYLQHSSLSSRYSQLRWQCPERTAFSTIRFAQVAPFAAESTLEQRATNTSISTFTERPRISAVLRRCIIRLFEISRKIPQPQIFCEVAPYFTQSKLNTKKKHFGGMGDSGNSTESKNSLSVRLTGWDGIGEPHTWREWEPRPEQGRTSR